MNIIGTREFVLKIKYQAEHGELETKIPDVTDHAKKIKLTELEINILDAVL